MCKLTRRMKDENGGQRRASQQSTTQRLESISARRKESTAAEVASQRARRMRFKPKAVQPKPRPVKVKIEDDESDNKSDSVEASVSDETGEANISEITNVSSTASTSSRRKITTAQVKRELEQKYINYGTQDEIEDDKQEQDTSQKAPLCSENLNYTADTHSPREILYSQNANGLLQPLTLIQMPETILQRNNDPEKDNIIKPDPDEQPKENTSKIRQKIGTARINKRTGEITVILDNHSEEFILQSGINPNFHQHAVVLDRPNQSFTVAGEINGKLVLTPKAV